MTGRAILRLIRPPGIVEAKRIALDGTDLSPFSERQMRRVRGERIAMVMQDPKFSLNPGDARRPAARRSVAGAFEGIASRRRGSAR